MRLIKQSDYKLMPWKNGLGQTAEIDRDPQLGSTYLWRLSQATINQDSEFSLFPGFHRWLAVWKGNGVILNENKLAPHTPFHFTGDQSTLCRLINGPVIDIGLIYNPNKIIAQMKAIDNEMTMSWDPRPDILYVFDFEAGDTSKYHQAFPSKISKSLIIILFNK